MKYTDNIFRKLLLLTLIGAAAVMSACVADIVEYEGPDKGRKTGEIEFTMKIPASQAPGSGTRATNTDEVVSEVDVILIGTDGKYANHQYGSIKDMTNNVVKFRVMIVPGTYNVLVIANASDRINTIASVLTGKTKAEILELLTFTNTGKWNIASQKIPMYGETGLKTISADMAAIPLTLKRMAARIDVKSTTTDFELQKIYLLNYNTIGNVAPKWETDGSLTTPLPSVPNLPTGGVGAKTGKSNALTYVVPAPATSQVYENQIYTFEASAATATTLSTAPCLIVEGKYKDGQVYYYRIDFIFDGSKTGTTAKDYMPLLRNHKYVVDIQGAEAIGYGSLAEALDSYTVPSNLKVHTIHYNEGELSNIVSNGQYMLGVEAEEVILDWTGARRNVIVMTDYEYDYSDTDDTIDEIGWRITGYSATPTGAISTTAPAWLEVEKETADASRCAMLINAKSINVSVPDVNANIDLASGETDRTAYVHIQAGRLSHKVKITQQTGGGIINLVHDTPNCYIVRPGGSVNIPAIKAYLAWKSPDLDEPIDPAGSVTCDLVWQDQQNLIEEVSLAGGDQGAYSRIYVKVRSGLQGNAVVAVKVDNEVKWSWHIWVTNYDPGDGIGNYKLMDRNLGALSNTWDPVYGVKWSAQYVTDNRATGMFYQWGRKDPFSLSSGYSIENTANDLKIGVEKPNEFMNTWNPDNDSWDTGDASNPKTIYDPCPKGWRVADDGLYGTYIEANPGTAAHGEFGAFLNGGRTFDSGFFPFTGGLVNGVIDSWAISDFACSLNWQNSKGRTSALTDSKLHPYGSASSSAGMPLRCVKDDSAKPEIPQTPPAGFLSYVGAFWKNNQKGERLITIPHVSGAEGAWTAQVIEGAEWIALDTNPTQDAGITRNAATESPADMNVGANDARYTVHGTATTVTGNLVAGGEIYFRIGLKSTLPTGAAPRYGVVLLSYNNNSRHHKIYIRQGEEADYLMRPGDPQADGTSFINNRNMATRFTVYNLSDPNRNSLTDFNQITAINARGGNFAQYPSQAGYLFLFNFSLRPIHPTVQPGITNMLPNSFGTAFWSDATESCPNGYRRPRDDNDNNYNTHNTVGDPANSEIRHSLWINEITGHASGSTANSAYGYYADGYFDRREIVSHIGTYNTTIECIVNQGEVPAYIGRLFFNPYNNASLFFPFAGRRYLNDNILLGKEGLYWTSSTLDAEKAWLTRFGTSYSDMWGDGGRIRHWALSIRCVRP